MVRLSPLEETRLLVKVSKLYYEEGLSQDDIILRLNLSRPKISRLLHQARDEGIVRITVAAPQHLFPDLEAGLEKRFSLLEAVVVETHAGDAQESILRELGLSAAAYLERSVRPGSTLGISWGTTLHSMVDKLPSIHVPGVKVVQIIGGLGQPEAGSHSSDLCHRLARAVGGQLTLLPAPGIVASQPARDVLLTDPYVQRAVEMFGSLDIAFVGIGDPGPESVLMRDGVIISWDELNLLLHKGAVGDIALRFFDARGCPVASDIDNRVIGITLEQLAQVRRVVGVAGGPAKFQAIQGALRGRLINVLITDSVTAERLLQ
jgi:DNA-binding transcriptional regulator LsrR (DeoR family)